MMNSDKQPPAARTPAPEAGPGHHDWHSSEYVREWIADYESRRDSRQAQFDLLADLLPFPEDAAVRILDLGGGWGPVTRHLLARFPRAHVTLLDFSEPMLAQARERLAAVPDTAGRAAFVQGDLSQDGAVAALRAGAHEAGSGGRFDAVVSSLCIHNLRPRERVPALYQEIRDGLALGGGFFNLDHIGVASAAVQDAWRRVRIQHLRRERQAQTGTLPPAEEIEQALRAQQETRRGGAGHASGRQEEVQQSGRTGGDAGQPRTLLDHLTWLRVAGFDSVDCFWRQDRLALIGGFAA